MEAVELLELASSRAALRTRKQTIVCYKKEHELDNTDAVAHAGRRVVESFATLPGQSSWAGVAVVDAASAPTKASLEKFVKKTKASSTFRSTDNMIILMLNLLRITMYTGNHSQNTRLRHRETRNESSNKPQEGSTT